MLIHLRVKPNSKKPGVDFSSSSDAMGGVLTVRVKSPPIKGKANKEVIERLAEFLDIPQSMIEITGGLTSKNKRAIVPDEVMAQLRSKLPHE